MCNATEIIASAAGFTLVRVGSEWRVMTAGRVVIVLHEEQFARVFFAGLTTVKLESK